MPRHVSRLSAVCLLAALAVPALRADILQGNDGDLIECEFLKTTTQTTSRGTEKMHQVKLEDGTVKEYPTRDYYLIKREPSWVRRAKNKEWYEKQAQKMEDTWKEHEKLANRCKYRSYLEEERARHYRRAYELQKPEIADNVEAHVKMAKKLEREYMLFEEAREEWRWVYNGKKSEAKTAADHLKLGDWCKEEGLYQEALAEYKAAVAEAPDNALAKQKLEELTMLLLCPVNSQMLRVIRDPFNLALKFLLPLQNKDGSYGGDVPVCGVHGHHAMTGLVGLCLVAKWEFETLEDFALVDKPPQEIEKIVEFFISNVADDNKLRGYDAWGPGWRMQFLAKAYGKKALSKYKADIEKRVQASLEEIRKKNCETGGWSYYHFYKGSITSTTATILTGMVDCKEAGLPSDDEMIEKGCAGLLGSRQGPASFTYRKEMKGEKPVGCCGRSTHCEWILMRAGKDQGGLSQAVVNLFQNRHLLAAIKGKTGTHIGEGKTAPYYYHYAHYWATRSMKHLPAADRDRHRLKMSEVIIADQGAKGEFSDWPMAKLHELFGTALGALTLYELAAELPPETSPQK